MYVCYLINSYVIYKWDLYKIIMIVWVLKLEFFK